jgi:NADPH:quinone reductase-like Zn-dependent oxidoreductase
MDMVRSIGADHVIDYTQEDFIKNGQRYDLIIDAAAYRSISDYKRVLNPEGVYVMVGGSTAQFFQAMFLGSWTSIIGSNKMGTFIKNPNKEDLVVLKDLLETAKIVPFIDRHYLLSEVPQALRYLEEGHAQGKVIITVN